MNRPTPLFAAFVALLLLSACGDDNASPVTESSPPDDPESYDVDTSVEYDISMSQPRFVVPGDGLPADIEPNLANNNVDIIFHDHVLYMAWRSAPSHFASPDTVMWLVSSRDLGETWSLEHRISIGSDMREPRFVSYKNRLFLMFFEAGSDMFEFDPRRVWRTWFEAPGRWTELEVMVDQPEVPWDVKVRHGNVYLTSYMGNHYETGQESSVEVYFSQSVDGSTFTRVNGREYVYKGGVSECAFEFDQTGNLWVVTRNEDGDSSGFGSHVCFAPREDLSAWQCPATCSPHRYDSPEMFRHGDDIFLVARRDIGGPYDMGLTGLSFDEQKEKYLMSYSLRAKTTALYKIDQAHREVVHLTDLPGAGDTAFASVKRMDAHSYLMVNYTSPLDDPDITWLAGQASNRGTQLYLMTITFTPKQAR